MIICLCILVSGKIYAKEKIPNFDAEKLLNCYSDNFWNDENLKKLTALVEDKEIKMTGVVYKVHHNYIDGHWFSIRQKRNEKLSDGWLVISCHFLDMESMENIKSGDKVTIKGYCKGWEGNFLSIYNCELISHH